ncbi:hypothetical protein H4S08_002737 [Coemansia sp. RSA 1365]|nr:hypothetical protein H4S08_002737 [Coemansia sp. RSA 1365]
MSITSPIPEDGILCKSNTPWPEPVAKWTAGQSITVEFEGSAVHGGGHCQFSLSYDGGKTFAVVHQLIKYCFVGGDGVPGGRTNKYTFDLPKNVPSSDKVVFAWSWINNLGNREFYMNCADVTISGGSSSSYTGKQMVIANHKGYPGVEPFGDPAAYEKGYSLYKNSPDVTVGPNGSSSGSGGSDDKSPSDGDSENDKPSPPPNMGGIFIEVPKGPGSDDDTETDSNTDPADNNDVANKDDDMNAGDPGNSPDSPSPDPPASPDSSPPDSVPTGSSGDCTHGAMECSSGGTGFRTCVWGKWDAERPCGSGTKCKSSEGGGGIYCGWP